MASINLDQVLDDFVPKRRLESAAASVEALLEDLETRYPRLRFRLRDETGSIRRYIRVFINGREIPKTGGLATSIAPTDSVDILHSIQGG